MIPPAPGLHYLPLFREQFVIVSDPDHRLSQLDPIRVVDLHNEAYLRRVNCEMESAATQSCEDQGIVTRPVYQSDRDDWILAMVAAGIGFAFMPINSVIPTQMS